MPKGDREILKADPEDGTTPIAHLLLEAIATSKMSGKAKGILLLICRKTYGWYQNGERFKETALSLGDCVKALGIDKRTAQGILAHLFESKVVHRHFNKPGYGYTYSINTRVGEWDNGCINHQQLKNLATVGLNKHSTVGLKKAPTPRIAKSAIPKSILNKNESNSRYPYRESKKQSRRPQDNTDPDKYIKGRYGHMVKR